eukprot:TRINITY_DN33016_c0_g1_i1.p2 TRINITY_DN33016_c0_g1~~TRINITY_DN33016_c0_g1_i1.p2  ORF type:complete len:113 (-),score=20.54 TRINITY_DN33016_c0_g1_i1:242-580(-)
MEGDVCLGWGAGVVGFGVGSKIMAFFFFKQKTAYEMQRGLVGSEMCIRDSNAEYMGIIVDLNLNNAQGYSVIHKFFCIIRFKILKITMIGGLWASFFFFVQCFSFLYQQGYP